MPRQVSRRPNGRPQYAPVSNPEAPQVVAHPNDNYVAPAESGFQQLAKGLANLQPGLNNYLGAKQKQQNQADFTQGIKDRALMGNVPNDQAMASLKPEQSAAYQKGFMIMHGRASGAQAAAELLDGYVQNKESFADPQAFNDYVTKFVKSKLGDINDADFLEGFMSKVEPTEQKLRAQYVHDTTAATQEQARTNLFSDMKDTLGKFAGAGASIPDLHTEMQQFMDVGHQIMGMSRQDVSEMQFEAVANAAMSTGRPELFDVFSIKKPDGTPGLANSPKWSTRIQDARAHVERALRATAAKQDDLTKYEWRDAYQQNFIEKGQWDEERVRGAVKADIITPDQALALKEKYHKQKQLLETKALIHEAISKDAPDALVRVEQQPGGKKLVTDGFDQWTADTLAQFPQDPARAIKLVGEKAEKLDRMPTPWQAKLEDANPALPKRFREAAVLYKQLKDNASLMLSRHLDPSKEFVYDVYWTALDAGASEQDALQKAHDVGDPQKFKKYSGDARYYMNREGHDAAISDLTSRLPFTVAPSSIKNETYVLDEVTRLMQARLAFGDTSNKGAYEWAIKKFQATHHPIDGRWVNTQGVDMSAMSTGAVEWYLKGRTAELIKNGTLDPEDKLYVTADPKTAVDGTLEVRSEINGIPVGRVKPKSVLYQKLEHESATAKQARADAKQKDQQATINELDTDVRRLADEVKRSPHNSAIRAELQRKAEKLQQLQQQTGLKPPKPPKPVEHKPAFVPPKAPEKFNRKDNPFRP